jgi:hypothetical protein
MLLLKYFMIKEVKIIITEQIYLGITIEVDNLSSIQNPNDTMMMKPRYEIPSIEQTCDRRCPAQEHTPVFSPESRNMMSIKQTKWSEKLLMSS